MAVTHHSLQMLDRAGMLVLRLMLAGGRGKAMGPPERGQFDETIEKTRAASGVDYEEAQVGGVPGWWCCPEGVAAGAAILYFHGGAYVLGSARAYRHLAGQIAARAKTAVFVAGYALAPEKPFPAAVDDAHAAYRGLVEQGFTKIALAGDSAGGGLALALLALTVAESRKNGAPVPVGAAVLSPWTDLALSGATMQTKADADPLLTRDSLAASARQYLQGADARDPRASALYADFTGLPPVEIHVGAEEILLDDSLRYMERLERVGGACHVHVWEGMMHVFSSHSTLRAARESISSLGDFLRARLSGTDDVRG